MAVTIKECPHCYTRVGFKEDGVCPACNKRLSDSGADPSKTLFHISEASVLAPICIGCGRSADRWATIVERSRSRASIIFRLAWSYILAFIAHGFIHLLRRDTAELKYPYRRIRVSVPLCEGCQLKNAVPKPKRVNFETGTLSFLIDRAVAVRLSPTAEPGYSERRDRDSLDNWTPLARRR